MGEICTGYQHCCDSYAKRRNRIDHQKTNYRTKAAFRDDGNTQS